MLVLTNTLPADLMWPGPDTTLASASWAKFCESIASVQNGKTLSFRPTPGARNTLKVVRAGDILRVKLKQVPTGGLPIPSDPGAFSVKVPPVVVAPTPTPTPIPTPTTGKRILHPIGDSNTSPGEVSGPETWAGRLAVTLDPAQWDVSRLGTNQPQLAQGGAASQEMLLLIGKDYSGHGSMLQAAIKPDLVNVFYALIGTNDAGKDSPATPYMDGDGSSSYAGWYAQGAPPPINFPGARKNIAEMARLIRAACASMNAPCLLLLGISPENGHDPNAANDVWHLPKQKDLREWMLANYQAAGWDAVHDVYADKLIGQYRYDNAVNWKNSLHWAAPGHERHAVIALPVLNGLMAGVVPTPPTNVPAPLPDAAQPAPIYVNIESATTRFNR